MQFSLIFLLPVLKRIKVFQGHGLLLFDIFWCLLLQKQDIVDYRFSYRKHNISSLTENTIENARSVKS